jgi:hypothetical protein
VRRPAVQIWRTIRRDLLSFRGRQTGCLVFTGQGFNKRAIFDNPGIAKLTDCLFLEGICKKGFLEEQK